MILQWLTSVVIFTRMYTLEIYIFHFMKAFLSMKTLNKKSEMFHKGTEEVQENEVSFILGVNLTLLLRWHNQELLCALHSGEGEGQVRRGSVITIRSLTHHLCMSGRYLGAGSPILRKILFQPSWRLQFSEEDKQLTIKCYINVVTGIEWNQIGRQTKTTSASQRKLSRPLEVLNKLNKGIPMEEPHLQSPRDEK